MWLSVCLAWDFVVCLSVCLYLSMSVCGAGARRQGEDGLQGMEAGGDRAQPRGRGICAGSPVPAQLLPQVNDGLPEFLPLQSSCVLLIAIWCPYIPCQALQHRGRAGHVCATVCAGGPTLPQAVISHATNCPTVSLPLCGVPL